MKIFSSPNRADKHAYEHAHGASYGNGGETLLCQSNQFIDTITGDRNQAEGEDTDGDTIVEPGFYCRNKS